MTLRLPAHYRSDFVHEGLPSSSPSEDSEESSLSIQSSYSAADGYPKAPSLVFHYFKLKTSSARSPHLETSTPNSIFCSKMALKRFEQKASRSHSSVEAQTSVVPRRDSSPVDCCSGFRRSPFAPSATKRTAMFRESPIIVAKPLQEEVHDSVHLVLPHPQHHSLTRLVAEGDSHDLVSELSSLSNIKDESYSTTSSVNFSDSIVDPIVWAKSSMSEQHQQSSTEAIYDAAPEDHQTRSSTAFSCACSSVNYVPTNPIHGDDDNDEAINVEPDINNLEAELSRMSSVKTTDGDDSRNEIPFDQRSCFEALSPW
eukprot:GHVH01006060.1.p1 GENE.GHVH01006060.1~~GHVH01006060.1.p1  ORF type:complete len:313 (+),score=50.52 GHVH01006060.1:505-1443(+)